MGVAIRHLTEILNGVEAKNRIRATLSDGYSDEYRSEYGIENTRRALIEAKRSGTPLLHHHRQAGAVLCAPYVRGGQLHDCGRGRAATL